METTALHYFTTRQGRNVGQMVFRVTERQNRLKDKAECSGEEKVETEDAIMNLKLGRHFS